MIRHNARTAMFALLEVVLLGTWSTSAQQPDLAVKAHFDLTSAADGFVGRLELLEDGRITPELDKVLWQSGGPDVALDENDPLLKQLAFAPLKPAILRLRDAKGSTIAEMKLQREQARLEAHQLHPGHRSILVTTDLSAGFGSYSGPLTQLLEVSQGTLTWVQARNIGPDTRDAIALVSTLKTAWRLVVAPAGSDPSRDILEVACRPNFSHPNSNDFLITYTRYHWTGSEWVVARFDRTGFWESDQSFPSFSRFPSIRNEAY